MLLVDMQTFCLSLIFQLRSANLGYSFRLQSRGTPPALGRSVSYPVWDDNSSSIDAYPNPDPEASPFEQAMRVPTTEPYYELQRRVSYEPWTEYDDGGSLRKESWEAVVLQSDLKPSSEKVLVEFWIGLDAGLWDLSVTRALACTHVREIMSDVDALENRVCDGLSKGEPVPRVCDIVSQGGSFRSLFRECRREGKFYHKGKGYYVQFFVWDFWEYDLQELAGTDIATASDVTKQVIEAVAIMSSLDLIHHDLTLSNIGVSKAPLGRVAVMVGGLDQAVQGTPGHLPGHWFPGSDMMPPEVRASRAYANPLSSYDMYGVGLIHAQLLCPDLNDLYQPDLAARVRRLMMEQRPTLDKIAGIENHFEFIENLVSSPANMRDTPEEALSSDRPLWGKKILEAQFDQVGRKWKLKTMGKTFEEELVCELKGEKDEKWLGFQNRLSEKLRELHTSCSDVVFAGFKLLSERVRTAPDETILRA